MYDFQLLPIVAFAFTPSSVTFRLTNLCPTFWPCGALPQLTLMTPNFHPFVWEEKP